MHIQSTRRPTPAVNTVLDRSDVEQPAVIVTTPADAANFSFTRGHHNDERIHDLLSPFIDLAKEAVLVYKPAHKDMITGIALVLDAGLQAVDIVRTASLAESISVADSLEITKTAAAATAAFLGDEPPSAIGRATHLVRDGLTLLIRVRDGMGERVDEVKIDQQILDVVGDSRAPGADLMVAAGKVLAMVFGDTETDLLGGAMDSTDGSRRLPPARSQAQQYLDNIRDRRSALDDVEGEPAQ